MTDRSHSRWLFLALFLGMLSGTLALAACKLPSATDKMKRVLSEHGTIDAEWEIRDEEAGKTYTYVLLRTKTGTHETYELIATDNQQKVLRQQVGGIDADGCYLLSSAMTTPWITGLPSEALDDTTQSGDETQTACLEYEDTPAWVHVPEEDRKAAQPPPPPPEPAAGPDAGMTGGDAGEEVADDPGGVESVLP